MKVRPEVSLATHAPTAAPAKTFADALRAGRPARPAARSARPAAGPPSAKPAAAPPAKPSPAPAKPAAATSKQPTSRQPSAPTGSKPEKLAQAARQRVRVAAAQVHQSAVESRTRSLRQLDASRKTEQVHALAHATSAQVSAGQQAERAEDRVRVALFHAIERECVLPKGTAGDREPASRPAPQTADSSRQVEIPAAAATGAQQPSAPSSASTQRAEAVAALVERIDAALKSGQPTLSLGLADRSGASSIEITRTAKGEVAVHLAARPGRRANLEAAAGELETSLAQRGLRLKRLTVG